LNIFSDTLTVKKNPLYLSGLGQGYGLDDRGFNSCQGLGIFLFITPSIPALGPIYSITKWVTVAI
jgi:hypothetical protein